MLYDNIKDVLYDIEWLSDNNNINNLLFRLVTDMEYPLRINNWDRYILDKDIIQIIIYNSKIIEYALYTERGDKLIQSKTQNVIYNDIDHDNITEPLLLYSVTELGDKIKLIDVIDNPKRWYNEVVTRMIKNKRSLK